MSQYIKKGQKFSVKDMNDVYEIIEVDVGAQEVHVVMDGVTKVFKVPYEQIEESFDTGFYIPEGAKAPAKKSFQGTMDGMHCYKCKNFFPYAEANQPDGTLECYSCRNGL